MWWQLYRKPKYYNKSAMYYTYVRYAVHNKLTLLDSHFEIILVPIPSNECERHYFITMCTLRTTPIKLMYVSLDPLPLPKIGVFTYSQLCLI